MTAWRKDTSLNSALCVSIFSSRGITKRPLLGPLLSDFSWLFTWETPFSTNCPQNKNGEQRSSVATNRTVVSFGCDGKREFRANAGTGLSRIGGHVRSAMMKIPLSSSIIWPGEPGSTIGSPDVAKLRFVRSRWCTTPLDDLAGEACRKSERGIWKH